MLVTVHCNTPDRLARYLLGSDLTAEQLRGEYFPFWLSLTEDEKEYYRSIDLATGLPCVEQVCGHRRL